MTVWTCIKMQFRALRSFFAFLMLQQFFLGLSMFFYKDLHTPVAYSISLFIMISPSVFILVWFIRKYGKSTFAITSINWKIWIKALLLGVSWYMLLTVFLGYPVFFTHYKIAPEYIIIAIYGVIGAPVIEEIVYRDFLQKRLLIQRPWLSILISSTIFALFHMDQKASMLPSFLAGILLGIIYHKTDKLIICILLHSMFNFLCSVFIFSFKYIPVLQILSLMVAISIAVYIIREFMKDTTLNIKTNPQINNKNETLY